MDVILNRYDDFEVVSLLETEYKLFLKHTYLSEKLCPYSQFVNWYVHNLLKKEFRKVMK